MILPLLSFVTEHLAVRTGSLNRPDHCLQHVLIKLFSLHICWKLGYLFLCTWPLLRLLCLFLSSLISAHSILPLSQKTKKENPSHHLHTSILLLHPKWHELVAGKHWPHANLLNSSDFEHSTGFTDFYTSMWALNGYDCYFFILYIIQFAFGYLKSIDLKSVRLWVNSTLLLSTSEKPQNRCPNRVQTLMKKKDTCWEVWAFSSKNSRLESDG